MIVKEVYAAGSYQVTSSDSIETQIVAGETADVDFTNDYNDKLIYSTGVVNHFEYEEPDGNGCRINEKIIESCKKLNRNHRILICAAFAATLIVCGVSVKPTLAYFTTYATAKGGIS